MAQAIGGVVPRMFKHNYMDVGLLNIAAPLSLLRYCPEVVFEHKHFLANKAEKDDTNKLVYPDGGKLGQPSGEYEVYGQLALSDFSDFHLVDILKKLQTEFKEYEK